MRRVVLVTRTEIVLDDKKCDSMSCKELVNNIQELYDYCGSEAVLNMGTKLEQDIEIESIDDVAVYKDYDAELEEYVISSTQGSSIIIDGETL